MIALGSVAGCQGSALGLLMRKCFQIQRGRAPCVIGPACRLQKFRENAPAKHMQSPRKCTHALCATAALQRCSLIMLHGATTSDGAVAAGNTFGL
jgi:hypothetical protein